MSKEMLRRIVKQDAEGGAGTIEPRAVKRLSAAAIEDVTIKNRARRDCGLSPIKITVRNCLACGYLFESSGNRTCGCTARRADI